MLVGKCALITGSTQGLGLAAARRFAAAGCHVVLNGFAAPDRIVELRAEIEREYAVRTHYCGADLQQPAEIAAMIASAVDTFGSIDVLVNNAVVRHAAPIDELTAWQWDESLAVNLSAAFHTIRLALPGMRQKRWGRIINVSSIYGFRGAAQRAAYVTTKTALLGLTRAVAIETLHDHITCNAVCPGTSRTPLHEATIRRMMVRDSLSDHQAEQRFLEGKQPGGRLIEADEVAALMVFLCGPGSGAITGAALPIDGGWSVA